MQTDVSTQNTQPVVQNSTKKRISKAIDVLLTLVIVALVCQVVLRLFFFTRVKVEQNSMEPTLFNEQIVFINKTKLPTRGDVVVFFKEPSNNKVLDGFNPGVQKLIKRVVATEGDCVWVEQQSNGKYALFVATSTGEILQENYYTHNGKPLQADLQMAHNLGCLAQTSKAHPFVVPQGCFFALGDNREVSMDSRHWGAFPVEQVLGVVI